MYILYGGPFTRTLINRMLLAEAGIAYELREISIAENEHRSEAYLNICPTGMVPALQTESDGVVFETHAINQYLIEHHRPSNIVPVAGDKDHGLYLSVMHYMAGELEPQIKRFFYPHRYSPRDDDNQAIQLQAQSAVSEKLGFLEALCDDSGPFFLGARLSLIDITFTYWLIVLSPHFDTTGFTRLWACIDQVRQRPALREIVQACEKQGQDYASLVRNNAATG